MSEAEQAIAWLLASYDAFSRELRPSSPPLPAAIELPNESLDASISSHDALASSTSKSRAVRLTAEPSEARNTLPSYTHLFSPRTQRKVVDAAMGREPHHLLDAYTQFSASLKKSRKVELRSVATPKELQKAEISLWRRTSSSVVTMPEVVISPSAAPAPAAPPTISFSKIFSQTSTTTSATSTAASISGEPAETSNETSSSTGMDEPVAASSISSSISVSRVARIHPHPRPTASQTSTISKSSCLQALQNSTSTPAESTSQSAVNSCSPKSASSSSSCSDSESSYEDNLSEDEQQHVLPCSWPANSPMLCARDCAVDSPLLSACDPEKIQNCCV